MPNPELLALIRRRATQSPLSDCASPASDTYQAYLKALKIMQDEHIAFFAANRAAYETFYDRQLSTLTASDRELVAPGVAMIVANIEASASRLAQFRDSHHEVLLAASETKMTEIGESMRRNFAIIGEGAVEAFEIFRHWRAKYTGLQVDLLPLFDQRGIGSGKSSGLFERCFAAWARAALPAEPLPMVRQATLDFLAQTAPEFAQGHIHFSRTNPRNVAISPPAAAHHQSRPMETPAAAVELGMS